MWIKKESNFITLSLPRQFHSINYLKLSTSIYSKGDPYSNSSKIKPTIQIIFISEQRCFGKMRPIVQYRISPVLHLFRQKKTDIFLTDLVYEQILVGTCGVIYAFAAATIFMTVQVALVLYPFSKGVDELWFRTSQFADRRIGSIISQNNLYSQTTVTHMALRL